MVKKIKNEKKTIKHPINGKKFNSIIVFEERKNQKNNDIKLIPIKKIKESIIFKIIDFNGIFFYFKYKIFKNLLLILNLILFYIFKFLPNVNCNLRKISTFEEIILTIKGTGEKSIFNKYYDYPPDEIEINGNRDTFNNNGENKYVFNFNYNKNTVKIYYNTSPESFKNMFKDLTSIEAVDFSNFDSSNVNDMTNMFYNCKDLEEVNMKGLKTAMVTSMEGMFEKCEELESIDLSSFDTSSVINMKNMFSGCEDLEDIDISNFDTSSVIDMSGMFFGCSDLEIIDLSNFKTTNTNMNIMFKNCYKLKRVLFSETNKIGCTDLSSTFQNCRALEYLDLSNFDTSSVTNMEYLFDNCYKLTSIDLSNFITSSVKNLGNMFSYCVVLESLDLSNFDTQSVTIMASMFEGCTNLIFLNTKSFIINNDVNIQDMFKDFSKDTKICYSEDITSLFSLNNTCEDDCFKESNKLISQLKKCIDKCSNDNTYKYEYKNKCYISCPDGTNISTNSEFICIKKIVCINYYNIDKTECFDKIPNGYYIFDEEQRIIDKCHENCKTCNQSGTNDDNNCLTCNENDYFYNGNCLKNCTYGYCTDDSGKKICACNSNIKCKECSDESLREKLCISCNVGYHPKIDGNSNNNLYFKCDNEFEGYYLDSNTSIYYPCYKTCKLCSNKGNENYHNCDKCIDNYDFLDELNKEKNCYEKCQFYYYINSDNEYKCTKANECPTEQNKLIIERKKCIDKCSNDNIYIFEYNNKCYIKCPDNTILENNTCKDIQISDKSIISESSDKTSNNLENTDNWSTENFFLGLYIPKEQNILSKDDIIKNIRKDILNHTLDNLISNVIKEKEDIHIKKDNVLYQITTSDNQNNNTYTNISTIQLGECEKILKDKYNISKNETLIILKIDYNIEGLLIPIIVYEVYHPIDKFKLNLSYCEESSINYNIPVTIDEDNLFKYDPNSEYYNDECNAYTTENGTDIILNDRKEEFKNNNMSLCENICEYVGYDNENKKAICECGIRYKELLLSEIDNDNNLLFNNFSIDNSTSNIGTMKCYETLFSKDGLLANFGSYILLIIIVLHIISIIIFYKCGYIIITENIQEIMAQKKKISKALKNNSKYDVNKKNSIYELGPKRKAKKSFYMSNKSVIAKIKKKKNIANPFKKIKRKKSRINQENLNINNLKSLSRFTLKENKSLFHFEMKRRKKSGSSIIIKKKYHEEMEYKQNNMNIWLYNDIELNTMDYNDALKIDKRTFIQYYISLIRTKHPIFFAFFQNKDYNISIIKICLFFLSFAIYFASNTFFFDFKGIHKIYEDEGNYNFSYFFPQIMYSFLISYVLYILIKYLVMSERNLLELKIQKTFILAKQKVKKIEKILIIKNVCYFVLGIIFLFFFWYYLSSFCAVYQNSQVYLIKNTFICFAISLIFPFVINLLPVFIRKLSLNVNNRECIYKISKFIQII